MSTHVQGFVPPDAKFKKMLQAYQACESAGVPIPAEVDKFFNGELPDDTGVKVSTYDNSVLAKAFKGAITEYNEDDGQGYEVDLRKVPSDIKIIRFTNSW
jgi:hypothetical protein